MSTSNYPFTAIVGQDDMRLALILNAINPSIGGVLIRGEKGTAKSTAVRALATILPLIDVAKGSTYPFSPEDVPNDVFTEDVDEAIQRPAPLVNLPLGVTEDRLIGTIDIEKVLQSGERAFEPGLLAQAHQGILYIDEVNLLGDHIVDVLLDSAAMGINIVEREGISASHPARFILVGTMNPEEGDLRPQLLDRFGLAVEVAGSRDRNQRAEIVRRRLQFEAEPAAFLQSYDALEDEMRGKIAEAQKKLSTVCLSDDMLDFIAEICLEFDVDGMRADIVIYKTARTLAAWEGSTSVTLDQVARAARLALLHRRRRSPLESAQLDEQKMKNLIQQRQNKPTKSEEGSGGTDTSKEGD